MNRIFPTVRLKTPATAAALALAAAIMLVPANYLPVLSTDFSGQDRTDTIYSGVVALWQQNLWAIAAIVFIASIVIPFLKLLGLAWLLWCLHRPGARNPRRETKIYATLDFIGRWSMLDVFLAAFLGGLVQFGQLSTVTPRSGIVAFGSAVVLTVLATQAFDPRLFWREPGASPS
jgi:paraquat-inducible protein A